MGYSAIRHHISAPTKAINATSSYSQERRVRESIEFVRWPMERVELQDIVLGQLCAATEIEHAEQYIREYRRDHWPQRIIQKAYNTNSIPETRRYRTHEDQNITDAWCKLYATIITIITTYNAKKFVSDCLFRWIVMLARWPYMASAEAKWPLWYRKWKAHEH